MWETPGLNASRSPSAPGRDWRVESNAPERDRRVDSEVDGHGRQQDDRDQARAQNPPTTASQVEEQEDVAAADTFFGRARGGGTRVDAQGSARKVVLNRTGGITEEVAGWRLQSREQAIRGSLIVHNLYSTLNSLSQKLSLLSIRESLLTEVLRSRKHNLAVAW